MESSERRKLILTHIKQSEKPVSASALATLAHVSRQIIVGDVALLRAAAVSYTHLIRLDSLTKNFSIIKHHSSSTSFMLSFYKG